MARKLRSNLARGAYILPARDLIAADIEVQVEGALLENGDTISIDVTKKTVDLEVDDAVLAERRKHIRIFGAQNETGWLGVYQRTVAPVHKGAVLNK